MAKKANKNPRRLKATNDLKNKSSRVFEKSDKRPLIDKMVLPAKARDNLSGNFAGQENHGPSKTPKTKFQKSTTLKARLR